jgi:hypothetical protein
MRSQIDLYCSGLKCPFRAPPFVLEATELTIDERTKLR